jgi:hypothetical protein
MKTKEEIWSKNVAGWRLSMTDKGYKNAMKAMDEWAIRFCKWIQGCNYAPATDEGKWQNQLPGENDIITTEELYQMFENQNK